MLLYCITTYSDRSEPMEVSGVEIPEGQFLYKCRLENVMINVYLCTFIYKQKASNVSVVVWYRSSLTRCIRQIMQPGKTYCHTCFAWARDATTSFAQAMDAKGNLQPTIYNHICV